MWCFLVSSAEESGKGETTCWGSQNHYSLYKKRVDQGKVIFFCTLQVKRRRDSVPSFSESQFLNI